MATKKQYKIIVLGAQGSGKGTQADLLSEKLEIPAVSMGDLLREEKRKKTQKAKEIASYIDNGLLVPYKITIDLIKKAIKKNKKGIIIDGFPRNMEQATVFDKFFKPTHIIFIKISEKETIRRLAGRRNCPKCRKIYHVTFNPPKKKDICDRCRAKLIRRKDDTPEAIKKRLEIFNKITKPVVKYYKKKYGLIKIGGENSIKKVHEKIMKKLSK